jgi:hypothetical protein
MCSLHYRTIAVVKIQQSPWVSDLGKAGGKKKGLSRKI